MNTSNHSAPILEAKSLSKSFGSLQVLQDIDLTLHRGEVLGLIGPSGSGKSTFIRCLNFMETPSRGEIRFDGRPVRPAFRDNASVRYVMRWEYHTICRGGKSLIEQLQADFPDIGASSHAAYAYPQQMSATT